LREKAEAFFIRWHGIEVTLLSLCFAIGGAATGAADTRRSAAP
jgi:hypothetical protein